jgi:tyrosinase
MKKLKNEVELSQTSITRRRVNVPNMLDSKLGDFRTAMENFQSINDNQGYDFIVGFHGIPGHWCWHGGGGLDESDQFPGQNYPAFLPWHRAYLKWFEDHLLDHNPNLAIPYWDWTSNLSHQEGIPKAYNDPNLSGGGHNPLANFNSPTLERTLGPGNGTTFRNPDPPNELPTSADVSALYSISDFSQFSAQLEDIHNAVHVWCHGSMGRVPTAAFDPIFWAHHCNIDRIWAIWQTKHGDNLPAGLKDLILAPFPYRVKDVLKISELGYEYAASGAEVKFD